MPKVCACICVYMCVLCVHVCMSVCLASSQRPCPMWFVNLLVFSGTLGMAMKAASFSST